MFGVNDNALRKHMLRVENLTLESAVNMARTNEDVSGQMNIMQRCEMQNTERHAIPDNIDAVNISRLRGRGSKKYTQNSLINCRYCEGRHARLRCPAYGKQCICHLVYQNNLYNRLPRHAPLHSDVIVVSHQRCVVSSSVVAVASQLGVVKRCIS